MNCREFEDIVNDLARAQYGLRMINAAAGLAHAEICERCAARLTDERALSAGFKSLAVSDEGKVAPDNVESALLEAFRAQAPNPITLHSPVQLRNWSRWALPRWALAAAILIAFGFIVYRSIQNKPRKDDAVVTRKTPAPQPSVKPEEQVVQDIVEPEPRRQSRTPRHRRANRPQPNRPFIRDSITAYAYDSEYTTDFFPLSYGADQTPMESGELIRVQMPRSALVRFGLPVSVERADVPVKADLLVGEDGLARAIRFVQ